MPPESDATRLLQRLSEGDQSVSEELLALIYGELHQLAAQRMGSHPPGHTLQPTALVHEAWMRLVDLPDKRFRSRAQFFALAAKAMRSILVDHARKRSAERRGGNLARLPLDAVFEGAEERAIDLLSLEDALGRLESVSQVAARVVELRFFAGLEHVEVGDALGVSSRTVERHWRMARVWLHDQLSAGR